MRSSFLKRKEKQLIRESILLTIAAIKDDIRSNMDAEANKTRAEAIKTLTEAYKNVK